MEISGGTDRFQRHPFDPRKRSIGTRSDGDDGEQELETWRSPGALEETEQVLHGKDEISREASEFRLGGTDGRMG